MSAIIPLYQVDAFTATPFKGNPAAVCLLDSPLDEATMKAIAAEMNLSETAFVQRLEDKSWAETACFSLRWFTPAVEVPLCGHATLATAAILFREVGATAQSLAFETRMSGVLKAALIDAGIALDFPCDPAMPYTAPAGLLEALGARNIHYVARNPRTKKLLVHVAETAEVTRLAPDFQRLVATASIEEIRGVIVTAAGDAPYDFISRYFAPWVGINEDPVTGSAHTVLTPYWAALLGKLTLNAYQASARSGELQVRLLPDDRVELVGAATTVFKGTLWV